VRRQADELGLAAFGYGLLVAAFAVGGLVGAASLRASPPGSGPAELSVWP